MSQLNQQQRGALRGAEYEGESGITRSVVRPGERNFIPHGSTFITPRARPDLACADESRERHAIYRAINSWSMEVIGCTMHMHVSSGAVLEQLQYKRTVFGCVHMHVPAIIGGAYFGEDCTLSYNYVGDYSHDVYKTSRAVLVKLDDRFVRLHGFHLDAGLVSVNGIESTNLTIQVGNDARHFHEIIQSERKPLTIQLVRHEQRRGERLDPEMQEHHYITKLVTQVEHFVTVPEVLEPGALYMWLSI